MNPNNGIPFVTLRGRRIRQNTPTSARAPEGAT